MLVLDYVIICLVVVVRTNVDICVLMSLILRLKVQF